MLNWLKKLGILAGVTLLTLFAAVGLARPVAAVGEPGVGTLNTLGAVFGPAGSDPCTHNLLGMRPWYQGLPKKDGSCTVGEPASQEELPQFVWTIVLNVLADLFMMLAYATIILAIYGGVNYLMSAGDPSKVAKGKKILISAVIGLVIALLATVIVNTIIALLGGAFV